jgi:hypothetical protein
MNTFVLWYLFSQAETEEPQRVQTLLKKNPELVFSQWGNDGTPLQLAEGHKDVEELIRQHGGHE